ncbi:MAG TPA: hypothetical protein VK866_13915 [Acidimicrobiales bacterium]|nr:hypothetical protein [Acidimicrobiales bacterium]
MATLSFEGESHAELVQKVRRWLASVDGEPGSSIGTADAVAQTAELTKDALRIIATAAPGPVAQSDIVKGLTAMGYQVTDATRDAVLTGLDTLEQATAGGVVARAGETGSRVVWEMNSAVAKSLLRSLTRR